MAAARVGPGCFHHAELRAVFLARWRQRRRGEAQAQLLWRQAQCAEDGVQPAGRAFLQHRFPQRHGAEAQRGGLAGWRFLDAQHAGAGDNQVEEGLMQFQREIGPVQMAL